MSDGSTGQAAPPAPAVRVAAAGSVMFTRRLSTERHPGLHSLLDVVRAADVGFLNVEGPIHEPRAHPVKQYIYSSYFTCEPWMADELAAAGFNMASLANNHMSDWSGEAVETNRRLLEAAGIACSGAGATLSDARAPAYLDLPTARVALVSVDSSWEQNEFVQVQMASDPHGGVRGRPGTNGLRWDATWELDAEAFERLRSVYDALGLRREELALGNRLAPSEDRFHVRGIPCVRAQATRMRSACRPRDLSEILAWIRTARAQADYVLVSHHQHAYEGAEWELPDEFAVEFARAAVDAGADAYIGHGYLPKGIELYRGRPILYDLGDWGTQDASQRRHPDDAYDHWGLDRGATPGDFADARERHRDPGAMPPAHRRVYDAYRRITNRSALAAFAFEGDRLVELTLHPTVMTSGARHERGTPVRAEGAVAQATLEHVAAASRPFGTDVEISGGVGRIALA